MLAGFLLVSLFPTGLERVEVEVEVRDFGEVGRRCREKGSGISGRLDWKMLLYLDAPHSDSGHSSTLFLDCGTV